MTRRVLLGCVLLFCSSQTYLPAQEFKAMTYNIEGVVGAGATLDTPQSRAVARVVEFNKPDILLINELRANANLWDSVSALQNWVNAFIPHFGGVAGSTYFTHVSTQTDGNVRNAVVSRFPIFTPATFDNDQRGLLSLQVELPNSRRAQLFLDHLRCCDACATRQAQAQFAADTISAWAATNAAPYLFAGDWNEDEERPICTLNGSYRPITTIRSASLSENRLVDLDGVRFSWTPRNPAPFLPTRFDYILPATGRLKATGGYVFNSTLWLALGLLPNDNSILFDDVRTGSDHYPVVGFFSLGPDPQAPQQLIARALATNQVEVGWVAGGSDHTGFRIERSLRSGSAFVSVAKLSASATNYFDNALRPAASYFYRVVATNNTGAAVSRSIAIATPASSAPLVAALHSPTVNSNNPWPSADDGTEVFDFDLSGGSLALAEGALGAGFGSITRVVFNHDEDFLYVGAQGVNRSGDNALLVLLDTKPGGVMSLVERGRPFAIGVARNVTFGQDFQPDVALLLGGEWGDGANFSAYSIGSRDFGQGVYALSVETNNNFAGFSTSFGTSPISQFGAAANLNAEIKLSRNALALRDVRNAFKAAAFFVGGDSDGRRYVSGRVFGGRVEGANDGLNFGFNAVRISGALVSLAKPDPATTAFNRITRTSVGLELEWTTQSSRVYTVQRTDPPLSPTNIWTSILTTNNANGPVVWTDPSSIAPADLGRLFRLMVSE